MTPGATLEIEKVAWSCRDCAVIVNVVAVAADTPTVPSVVGAPSTTGSPVVPSSALVSQRVYAEVSEGFGTEDMGDLTLHGFARPMRAYRLLGSGS